MDRASEIQTLKTLINNKNGYTNDRGCWLINSKNDWSNYTVFRYKGKSKAAHILSAIAFLNHTFDSPLNVCHKCDVKGCFNPEHLFIGTDSDNRKDMLDKKRNLIKYPYGPFRIDFENRLVYLLELIGI